MKRWAWITIVTGALAGAVAGEAEAQAFGPQLSYGTDSSLGIGVRMFMPLTGTVSGVDLLGSADYFFGDEPRGVDISWIELNGGLSIPVVLSDNFRPYLGAGLNLAIVSYSYELDPDLDDTETELGINVIAGWQSPRSIGFRPFVEVRGVVGGAEQVVFTAGLTVGGGR